MENNYDILDTIDSNLAIEKKLSLIEDLIKQNANVNLVKFDYLGSTPLLLAAKRFDHDKIIIALRKAGADPYTTDSNHFCSIQKAISHDLPDNLKALLVDISDNKKVVSKNIYYQSDMGDTFLHDAVGYVTEDNVNTRIEMIKILFEHKIDPNIRGTSHLKSSALDIAIQKKRRGWPR